MILTNSLYFLYPQAFFVFFSYSQFLQQCGWCDPCQGLNIHVYEIRGSQESCHYGKIDMVQKMFYPFVCKLK